MGKHILFKTIPTPVAVALVSLVVLIAVICVWSSATSLQVEPLPYVNTQVKTQEDQRQNEKEISQGLSELLTSTLIDGTVLSLENNMVYAASGTEKTAFATTTDGITNFAVAFSKKELYVLSSNGELLKKPLSGGVYTGLVMADRDMQKNEVLFKRPMSDEATTTYSYTKGRVLNFWLSPDEQYIVYEIQNGLTRCCMSPPTIKQTRLMVMKHDGSNKELIDQTPIGGDQTFFNGWFFDSSGFIFHEVHPDGGTSGSQFYVAKPNQSRVVLFESMQYGRLLYNHTINVAWAEPYLSPTSDLMVYRKGGYGGTEIILSRIDGSEDRVLMEVPPFSMTDIIWSEDGLLVTVLVTDKGNRQEKVFDLTDEVLIL